MSLKFDIFQINDLARVVPADMEIKTFIGILWWATAVVGERAAAEPLEPMSLPREPEAVAAGDDSFLLVEPDEPAGPVTIVVATADDAAADAATAAAIAAALQSPLSDGALAEAEPAPPAKAEDFVADPAPPVPPPAAAADAPARATSPLGVIWSKADDQRLVDALDPRAVHRQSGGPLARGDHRHQRPRRGVSGVGVTAPPTIG